MCLQICVPLVTFNLFYSLKFRSLCNFYWKQQVFIQFLDFIKTSITTTCSSNTDTAHLETHIIRPVIHINVGCFVFLKGIAGSNGVSKKKE